MNVERSILIGFLGNYLINTVVASLVAFVPVSAGGGILTPQYISFIVLAVIVVAVLTWWYGASSLKNGIIFGVIGFVVAILTAFVTGVAGVLAQTGSLSAVVSVLPNFWPFLANLSTIILLGYWVIPAALVGWWMQPKVIVMGSSGM